MRKAFDILLFLFALAFVGVSMYATHMNLSPKANCEQQEKSR